MTITQLKNPKTDQYNQLKNYIFSNNFPWFYNQTNLIDDHIKDKTSPYILIKNGKQYHNVPYFTHAVLVRPFENKKYSTVNSNNISQFSKVLNEIFNYNDIELNCLFRVNVNLVTPKNEVRIIPPHCDHPWPHKNMIIYLTDAGGKTFVETGHNTDFYEYYDPKEDDIATFSGYPEKHCAEYGVSEEKNRVIIVATYI